MSDKTSTRLDEAFQAAVKQLAVVDAITRREERDAYVRQGGDALAWWLEQDAPNLFFPLPPPPDMKLDAAIHRALQNLLDATKEWGNAILVVQKKPTVGAQSEGSRRATAALRSKAVLDMLRRIEEMDECRRGEGDPFLCWEKYGIWTFPFPRPLHPDWLAATTVSESWAKLHSVVLDLQQVIGMELAEWKPPG